MFCFCCYSIYGKDCLLKTGRQCLVSATPWNTCLNEAITYHVSPNYSIKGSLCGGQDDWIISLKAMSVKWYNFSCTYQFFKILSCLGFLSESQPVDLWIQLVALGTQLGWNCAIKVFLTWTLCSYSAYFESSQDFLVFQRLAALGITREAPYIVYLKVLVIFFFLQNTDLDLQEVLFGRM